MNLVKEIDDLFGAFNWKMPEFMLMAIRDDRDWKEDVYNDYFLFMNINYILASRGTVNYGVKWADEARRKKKGFPPFPGIIDRGKHPQVWRSGKYRGKAAMVPGRGCKPFRIIRDTNRNGSIDEGEPVEDGYGFFMHAPSSYNKIELSSAGCPVPLNNKFREIVVQEQIKNPHLADFFVFEGPKQKNSSVPDDVFEAIKRLAYKQNGNKL
jgi:hypothetical protein